MQTNTLGGAGEEQRWRYNATDAGPEPGLIQPHPVPSLSHPAPSPCPIHHHHPPTHPASQQVLLGVSPAEPGTEAPSRMQAQLHPWRSVLGSARLMPTAE